MILGKRLANSTLRILLFAQGSAGIKLRSGIHRVTIELAKALAACGLVELVKWDSVDGQLRFFNEAELKALFGKGPLPDGIAVNSHVQDVESRFNAALDPSLRYWLIFPEIAYHTMRSNEVFTRIVAQCRENDIGVASIFYDLIPITNELYDIYKESHVEYVRELIRSDVIIPISSYSATALRDYYAARIDSIDRVHIIDKIRPVGLPEGSRVAQPNGDAYNLNTILLVGSVEPRKRQVEVLRAWNEIIRERRELGQVRLVVIGNLHPASAEALKEVMQANPDIAYYGYRSDEFVADCYRKAMFTVFASTDEGYGLPIAESLARGVPCLTANFGSMAEIAEGGGCLTVNVNDFEALKAGLLRMAVDGELRGRLCSEIAIRGLRTWSDYAQDVVNVLQEVDSERRGNPSRSEARRQSRIRYAADGLVEQALAASAAEEATRLKLETAGLRAEIAAERARTAQLAVAVAVHRSELQAITHSTTFRLSAFVRYAGARFLRAALIIRRILKLIWWTVTLQLVPRLKAHLDKAPNYQDLAPHILLTPEPDRADAAIGVTSAAAATAADSTAPRQRP